jgi:dienelactone hydrolase
MSLKNILIGCTAVCALSVAQAQAGRADPLAIANIAATGPLSKAHVPNLEYHDAYQPNVAADLNEQIIRIPVDASGSVTLETTIFKPNGPGPFPMVVFNHGKIQGDPRDQARSRPIAFAREFVRRGYIVVAPNREGFAGSGGTYQQDGCDVERNGISQADDVSATIAYMSKQSDVDAKHIVVAGSSHGGLTTIAYGVDAAPGVRGLINFSGGLRQDACTGWQNNLTQAFGTYGENTRVPSLWLYGDNDSVWTPSLSAQMYAAYVAHGAHAQMVDFGDYKNDAHRLVVDRDGVNVWWPSVEAFLARIGMPTSVQYRVDEPSMPKASGYAALDAVNAVPFLDAAGRAGYQNFLKQYPTRAFAVSDSGAWSWAEGGDNPMALAVQNCEKEGAGKCHLYAVNDSVVWKDGESAAPVATAQASADTPAADDSESHALASR